MTELNFKLTVVFSDNIDKEDTVDIAQNVLDALENWSNNAGLAPEFSGYYACKLYLDGPDNLQQMRVL